jgi:electron transfer flavoprotein beta subunit
MKILVPTKRVPDPDQRIRALSDGSTVDTSGLSFVVNPFDLIATEEALRLQAEEGAEVVTVGIGCPEMEKELRMTLAMGVDRTLLIETQQTLDPWNVAKALQLVVENEKPDLILMGKQAVDDDSNQVGQFLAALLDWPQATFASQVRIEGSQAHIERETDGGIESIVVNLPALVTVDLRLNEPRYASMPQIMKAKRRPVEQQSLEELGWKSDPRCEILEVEVLSSKRTCRTLSSVDELVQVLRREQVW